LNVVEFGPGLYGAEAASRAYFHKSAAQLSDDEAGAPGRDPARAAQLVGRSSGPMCASVEFADAIA